MIKRFMLGMGAGGVFLLIACGGVTGPDASSSSHWIRCETHSECESVPGASACERGYCVDVEGERIARDSLGEAGAPDSGATTGNGGTGNEALLGSGGADLGSTSNGGDALDFTTCDINNAMLTCQGSVCHGSPGRAPSPLAGAGMDLFQPDRATTLVDQPASYDGVLTDDLANCPAVPELRINSQNPADSLILKKLNGSYSCGTGMPQVGMLAPSDLDCITAWVLWVAENYGG